MTYEEKRRWLSRYGDAMVKAKHLRDDLDEAERDTGCTTQQLTGMPGGSGDGQSLARTVERIERAEKALNALISTPNLWPDWRMWTTRRITRSCG